MPDATILLCTRVAINSVLVPGTAAVGIRHVVPVSPLEMYFYHTRCVQQKQESSHKPDGSTGQEFTASFHATTHCVPG